MNHPTDDILLAYVRQQQRSLWPVGLQEHIATCSSCSQQCRDLQQTGAILEQWTRSSATNPVYATVSIRVMRELHEQQTVQARRMYNGGVAHAHIVFPIAVVCMLLISILLVGWGVNIAGQVAKSKQSQPTPPAVTAQPTAASSVPTPTLGPIPTVGVSPTTGPVIGGNAGSATSVASQSGASIKATDEHCTTAIDIAQDQLHVCGANFTPGTTVVIYYHIGTSMKKHSVQVVTDGTFIDILYIHDCKDVPSSIYAQSTSQPSEAAYVTKTITFGTCQSFSN